jgi:hypothetical protein
MCITMPHTRIKISGIEVVTPEATNILVWFGSLYVFISP